MKNKSNPDKVTLVNHFTITTCGFYLVYMNIMISNYNWRVCFSFGQYQINQTEGGKVT